jgi:hypothetical protein
MRLADRDDPLRDEVIAQVPTPERRPVFFSGIARVLALAAILCGPSSQMLASSDDAAVRFDHEQHRVRCHEGG